MAYYKDLISKLKFLRIEGGYTKEAFAESIGVTAVMVYNWESERRIISLDNLRKIAVKFDVSIDYLVGLKGSK